VTHSPTGIQIMNGADGKPAFNNDLIPHEVVSRIVDGTSAIRAWREYLHLTQEEVANRMSISQSAYAQQETVAKPRKPIREKIAAAFGINANQLEL